MIITFITGNEGKLKAAKAILGSYGFGVEHMTLEVPEIQSLNVEEVAALSAEFAAEKLNIPVIVTDAGYYFEALNGFPGAFIKFVNMTLTSKDLLDLMAGHSNRRVIIKECLAYCEPGQKAKTFMSQKQAQLAYQPEGNGSAIDNIILLEGYEHPVGVYPWEEIQKYWQDNLHHFNDFAEWLSLN